MPCTWRRLFPWQCSDLDSHLAIPRFILLLVGLGSFGRLEKKITSYIYLAYSILVVCVYFAGAIAVFCAMDLSEGILDNRVAYFLNIDFSFIQYFLICLAIIHASRNGRFEELAEMWKRYKLDDLMTQSEKTWVRRRISVLFSVSATIIAVVFIYGFIPRNVLPYEVQISTVAAQRMMAVFKYGIFTLFSTFTNLLHMSAQYLFFVFSIHLTCAWRAFGNYVQNMEAEFEEVFKYTILKHGELTSLVHLINTTFGFYILVISFFNTASVLSIFYLIAVSKSWGVMEGVILASWVVTTLSPLVILGYACLINDAANSIQAKLFTRYTQFLLQPKSSDQKNMAAESCLVLDHFRTANVAVSPFGLFTIKKSFIMAIMSILVTYYITLCQFVYQPQSQSLGCSEKNVTI